MLSRLRLINFRRHVDTELAFSSDAQIIAITGGNGAGKTTLLEAITYALYGEGRYGRRNLARMVRRGGEHEGMQVELDFTVGDVEYQLVRRYEKGKTSATLLANGNLAMQSADGVTAEIAKIFGMDSAGFRLAVIAQQFDVNGLADLTAAARRKTVTRLLRQDALTRAKLAAGDEKNRQLDVVRAMGSGPDLDELEAELHEVREDVAAAQAAVGESEKALSEIDRELAGTSTTRQQWQDSQVQMARAEATVAANLAESDRLSRELVTIHVPDAPQEPAQTLAAIVAALSETNIAVAKAEAGVELARTVEQTRTELAGIDVALARVEQQLDGDTPAKLAMAASSAVSALTSAQQALEEARAAVRQAAADRVGPAGELAALRARRAQAEALGAVCDTCEQPIAAEHRAAQHAQHEAREAELVAQLAALDATAVDAAAALGDAEDALVTARTNADRMGTRRQMVESLVADRKDLNRRKETYTDRLARIQVPDVDLDELYARKGALELAKAAAEQYEQTLTVRAAALERRGRVADALSAAQARVEAATAERDAARPAAELVQAHERLVELEQRRSDEVEMVGAVRTEAARLAEREAAVLKSIKAARAQHDKLRQVRAGADRAAKAARLLDVTAERMATQIRPALEGAISDALNRLSEGRFTAVEVSDSYDITVLDDGKFEPLSELSGGERVLVALATRLALAQVVSGRHASGGVGMLVLDEVFGSQDAERREAILAALRALRSDYGQILLISHVGGLEEAADRVIDVSARVEDGMRVAEVVAA